MSVPSNRADFRDSDSHKEKIEKHNKNVEETIERAKQGEEVNLTDLLIDKEELHIEEVEK